MLSPHPQKASLPGPCRQAVNCDSDRHTLVYCGAEAWGFCLEKNKSLPLLSAAVMCVSEDLGSPDSPEWHRPGGSREGLASSGGQWGLPVGTQGPRTHRRKCGSARPLPAPPPTPRHPPPCRPPERKAAVGRAVLTGSDWPQAQNAHSLPTDRAGRTPPPTRTDARGLVVPLPGRAAPGCGSWAHPRSGPWSRAPTISGA